MAQSSKHIHSNYHGPIEGNYTFSRNEAHPNFSSSNFVLAFVFFPLFCSFSSGYCFPHVLTSSSSFELIDQLLLSSSNTKTRDYFALPHMPTTVFTQTESRSSFFNRTSLFFFVFSTGIATLTKPLLFSKHRRPSHRKSQDQCSRLSLVRRIKPNLQQLSSPMVSGLNTAEECNLPFLDQVFGCSLFG